MPSADPPDVVVRHEGRLVLLYPLTDPAREWLYDALPDSLLYHEAFLLAQAEATQLFQAAPGRFRLGALAFGVPSRLCDVPV